MIRRCGISSGIATSTCFVGCAVRFPRSNRSHYWPKNSTAMATRPKRVARFTETPAPERRPSGGTPWGLALCKSRPSLISRQDTRQKGLRDPSWQTVDRVRDDVKKNFPQGFSTEKMEN